MYELWIWVVKEANNEEGSIAALIPGSETFGPMVLQARSEQLALKMMPIAYQHSENTGLPVRLVHLIETEI